MNLWRKARFFWPIKNQICSAMNTFSGILLSVRSGKPCARSNCIVWPGREWQMCAVRWFFSVIPFWMMFFRMVMYWVSNWFFMFFGCFVFEFYVFLFFISNLVCCFCFFQ